MIIKVKGYIAEDKDGTLWFFDNKPYKREDVGRWYNTSPIGQAIMIYKVPLFGSTPYSDTCINNHLPKVSWLDDNPTPVEVELEIPALYYDPL